MVAIDKIVSVCAQHGFVFQSSGIYGGTGSCWDCESRRGELNGSFKS